jgi:hypothetical protein
MKTPIIGLLVAALLPWSLAMCGHYAVAATDSKETPAPVPARKVHYKIIATIVHPQYGPIEQFTYGTQEKGPFWFATADECEKASDEGGSKDFETTKTKLLQIVRQKVDPKAVVVYECAAVSVPEVQ